MFVGVNPNRPIEEIRPITESYSGYGPFGILAVHLLYPHVFRNSNTFQFKYSGNCKFTASRTFLKPVIVGYEKEIQFNKLSKNPGYIFSVGDLVIDTIKPCYIGTIVSQGTIRIKHVTTLILAKLLQQTIFILK